MTEDCTPEQIERMRLASTSDLLISWAEYVPDYSHDQAYLAVTAVLNERRLHQNGLELMTPSEGWRCACTNINGRADAKCASCGLVLSSQLKPVLTASSLIDPELHANGDYVTPMTLRHILFSFRGRIPRGVFWLSSLGLAVVAIALLTAIALVADTLHLSQDVGSALLMAVGALMFWCSFAVQAKRWHDVGKSRIWLLLHLIPSFGAIISLYYLGFLEGDSYTNQYGVNPLAPVKQAPARSTPWESS